MFKKRFILGLFVLAALALTAADASRAQSRPEVTEEFHQTYPLAAGGRVSLQNINGAVRVVTWDRAEVKVDAVKRAHTPERLREAQIRVDASAGRVRIETEYPDHTLRWSDRDGERHENPASVDYTLTVPRGAAIDEINLVNGSLTLEGLAGSVEASSVNGRVTATGLTGPTQLSVVNGRLEATLDALSDAGRVTLSAVNGPLVVTLPSDANAMLHADTVHGGITNDFNLPVRVGEYVGRSLQGRLGSGAARVRLNNVNGPIQIRRASDGRQPSAVTNLLSETRGRGDIHAGVEVDVDVDVDVDEIKDAAKEAARAATEVARATARDDRERQREQREMQREVERASREARLATAEVERDAARAAREDEAMSAAIAAGVKSGLKDAGRAAAVYDTARVSARESKSYPVTGTPRVRVETFDGAINVHAWDKPEVMYTAVKRAADDRELQGIKLTAQAAGGEVSLRAEFDKSFAHVYREQGGRVTTYSSNASAEFDLYVPRNATLFVSTGDGRLRVDGVAGELDIRTGDGPIDVTGARGKLRAETGDGRIRIDNFDGDADTRTGDGRITLDGNFRSLSARTGDGTISLTLPDGANATVETNASSVFNDGVAVAETDGETRVRRWRVGSGGQVFTLRTGEGQIILRRR